jgi:DNA-binding transcriptional MocR family regulator
MIKDSAISVLSEELKRQIGGMSPGERLPSSREIMRERGVSPITVSRAISALAAEGLVVVRPGAGTFVAQPAPAARRADLSWQSLTLGERSIDADGLAPLFDPPDSKDVISFGLGYLHPSLIPQTLLATAWARASRLPDAFLRPPPSGLIGLRTWFARNTAASIEPRDVLIASGGQAAIGAAIRAVVPPGGKLLVESPTYPGAIAIARAAGITVVPVPTDAGGIRVNDLALAMETSGARAIYVQPNFQNPTGAVLDSERRQALLQLARDTGAFVIEDDFARWLAHDGQLSRPLIADDTDGHVIYVSSLTKPVAPSLRVSAIISRGAVSERIGAIRVLDDLFVPRPVQEAALELVSRAGWRRHISGLADELSARSDAMLTAIRRQTPQLEVDLRPSGGMHVWAELPDGLEDMDVRRRARDGGVDVNAGRAFFPSEPPGSYLRLSFAAVRDLATIDEGIRRLAAAVPELT